ncbi:MAG: VOC family protein [Thermoplasmata archaeon]|nr:VOC family protein [Thermoplasmata archaeon]
MGANVRYIGKDVGKAIEFYTQALGFEVVMQPEPGGWNRIELFEGFDEREKSD